VSDVLARYPATGTVFIQRGPLFEVQAGQLSPQYRDATLEEYAADRGLDLRLLLQWLNAEAASAEGASARASGPGAPAGPLGYTGAYRELSGAGIESEPVVARQSARGPE
jgi:hypothetical protein